MNNNLIDFISKTEEFYISELESLNTYRKTKPKDLIYLDKIPEKKESFFKKKLRIFIFKVENSNLSCVRKKVNSSYLNSINI